MPFGIRLSNVPVPEMHVAGLVIGGVLQRRRPMRAFRSRHPVLGAVLCLAGFGVVATAVRAWGDEPQ